MFAQMQRATANGQPARWSMARVVGVYKLGMTCTLEKDNSKEEVQNGKRGRLSDKMVAFSRNQKSSRERKKFGEVRGQTTVRQGIRKAVSLGQIL